MEILKKFLMGNKSQYTSSFEKFVISFIFIIKSSCHSIKQNKMRFFLYLKSSLKIKCRFSFILCFNLYFIHSLQISCMEYNLIICPSYVSMASSHHIWFSISCPFLLTIIHWVKLLLLIWSWVWSDPLRHGYKSIEKGLFFPQQPLTANRVSAKGASSASSPSWEILAWSCTCLI